MCRTARVPDQVHDSEVDPRGRREYVRICRELRRVHDDSTRGDVCHRRVEVAECCAIRGIPVRTRWIQSVPDATREDAWQVPHPAGLPEHREGAVDPTRIVEVAGLGEHLAPHRALPDRKAAAAETILLEAPLPQVTNLPSR